MTIDHVGTALQKHSHLEAIRSSYPIFFLYPFYITMPAGTNTKTQTSPSTKRGGKQGSQRGRNGHRGGGNKSRGRKDAAVPGEPLPDQPTTDEVASIPGVTEDAVVCWICAEPVKYYSVSACNHRTCHVCALRLRALYKKLDCTFCKVRHDLSGGFLTGETLTLVGFLGTSANCDIHNFP